jgi:hypothetical protein
MNSRIATLLTAFALAGEWVTTPAGDHVCKLTGPLHIYMTLQPDFCEDWQPGFPRPQRGMTFPFEQGWVRRTPDSPTIQIHVEDRWVP